MKNITLAMGLALLSLNVGTLQAATPSVVDGDRDMTSDIASALQGGALNVPVNGTLPDGGQFNGIFSITKFAVDSAGKLLAIGNVAGTATSPLGGAQPTQVNQPVTQGIPTQIVSPSGACDIVTLNLDALHLDVLGLVVDLAPVDLLVNAVPGGGNLLGNLLCGVSHLLDNPLTGLLGLNKIIGQINDLIGGLLGGLGGLGGAAAGTPPAA